ncbi:MAG: hypothetical protein M3O90_07770 [Actinomycetota bacterium]|nr:hypothetical protein [Actinomycetota bacterium]
MRRRLTGGPVELADAPIPIHVPGYRPASFRDGDRVLKRDFTRHRNGLDLIELSPAGYNLLGGDA